MSEQQHPSVHTCNSQTKARASVRGTIHWKLAVALLALLLPGSLLADPVYVRISQRTFLPPVVEIFGAPNGYNLYTGEHVNNFSVEDGALITLPGVDTAGTVPNQGWRFIDPRAPNPTVAAASIVWVDHDNYLFSATGDLRVGFNIHFRGGWYTTPADPPVPGKDINAGPVRPYWVTVYSSPVLVVQFKAVRTTFRSHQ